jgi:hypothetical protein
MRHVSGGDVRSLLRQGVPASCASRLREAPEEFLTAVKADLVSDGLHAACGGG